MQVFSSNERYQHALRQSWRSKFGVAEDMLFWLSRLLIGSDAVWQCFAKGQLRIMFSTVHNSYAGHAG
jgi:hypothetical protein